MGFLTEMHFHTAESSNCANVSAEDSVPLYHKYGYKTIIVTDHMAKWYVDNCPIDHFLLGYRTAKKAAEKYGINVILGMELNIESMPNDYLLYGMTEELVYANPNLPSLTEEEMKAFADENGLLVVQAHPYRSVCVPGNPKNLHGFEIYNGNTNWYSPDQAGKAIAFADKYNLIKTAGSDFHEMKHTPGTGLIFPEEIKDSATLLSYLKSGNYEFAKSVTFADCKD